MVSLLSAVAGPGCRLGVWRSMMHPMVATPVHAVRAPDAVVDRRENSGMYALSSVAALSTGLGMMG